MASDNGDLEGRVRKVRALILEDHEDFAVFYKLVLGNYLYNLENELERSGVCLSHEIDMVQDVHSARQWLDRLKATGVSPDLMLLDFSVKGGYATQIFETHPQIAEISIIYTTMSRVATREVDRMLDGHKPLIVQKQTDSLDEFLIYVPGILKLNRPANN